MKSSHFVPIEQIVKSFVGEPKDICSFKVYSPSFSSRLSNIYIIAVGLDNAIHILDLNNSTIKQFIFSPREIKKIKISFYHYFYFQISLYSIFLFFLAHLTLNKFSISLSIFHSFLFFAVLFILFIFVLTKIFYYKKIQITTIYNTTYTYLYPDNFTIFYSKTAQKMNLFEQRIRSIKQ